MRDFIPDFGTRHTMRGRSLVIHAMASGLRLTSRQVAQEVAAIDRYLAAVMPDGEDPPSDKHRFPPPLGPLEEGDDTAYKFTDENGLAYLRAGSFKVGTAAHYRSVEVGESARDLSEAIGTVVLEDKVRQFTATVTTAFHYNLFCLAKEARSWRRPHLHKFGPRIVRINRLREFTDRMRHRLGARKALIHDVRYGYPKISVRTSTMVEPIRQAIGGGDLDDDKLDRFDKIALDHFLEEASLPLLFMKRMRFRSEIERRLAFEMPTDVDAPYTVIEDVGLRDFVDVVL